MDPEQIPLRDLHLPEAIGWWPLAPGWWILIAIALVGLAGRVGAADSLQQALFTDFTGDRAETLSVNVRGLRFPPNDLGQTLAQQLMVLEAAR